MATYKENAGIIEIDFPGFPGWDTINRIHEVSDMKYDKKTRIWSGPANAEVRALAEEVCGGKVKESVRAVCCGPRI